MRAGFFEDVGQAEVQTAGNPHEPAQRGVVPALLHGDGGAPGLVVEIVSPSSRGMDYGTKQNLYAQAGVREYWIVDPAMRRTMVTCFAEDPAPLIYPFSAPVPSMVLPGFEVELVPIVEGA